MLPSQRDARWSSEYPKTLGSWLELDYFRRPRPHRRIRRRIVLAAFIACALAMAAVTFIPGDRTIYQAGPVSRAHALFNEDCEACHTVKFATMSRLVHHDDAVRSVSDAACERCHTGAIHHQRQSTTPSCASCHREHRDRAELARIDDSHCTSCHGDLKSHTLTSADKEPFKDRDADFKNVLAFLGSPEPHPAFTMRERYKDPGNIKFSHKDHLEPKDPQGLPEPGSNTRRKLDCNDCHQPDAERRYMLPISYRQHCASCHPLLVQVFDTPLKGPALEAAERFRKLPAPHPEANETAETVRAVLRDRYLEFARSFPSVYDQSRPSPPPSPILGRRSTTAPSTVKAQSEWAETQLKKAGERLFQEGQDSCLRCHNATQGSDREPGKLPHWDPSPIPKRWMTHSTFSHDSHRALKCLECHEHARGSTKPADVLMPTIESCRKCHTGGRRGASADCVECHLYHGPSKARNAPHNLAIEEFLSGLGSRPQPAHTTPAGGSNSSR